MISDAALVAALFAALVAGWGGWRGGRPFALALITAAGVMVVNLIMAWKADDPEGTTVEGMTAAVGMMMSVSLFALALIGALLGFAAKRLLRA